MTKTLNVLVLGSVGVGKTYWLTLLANKLGKSLYNYTEEKALTALSTVTSYELKDIETKTNITIIEVLKFYDTENTIKTLRGFKQIFDVILLFIDGLGYENSKIIAFYQLKTVLKVIKYDKYELEIGIIVTKSNLIEKVNSTFVYNNLLRIFVYDLVPNKISTYKKLGSAIPYTFKLFAYQDNYNDSIWFFLGHVEQIIVTFLENRISILPPYEFFSKTLLRYWTRNVLGSFIIKSMNLDKKSQQEFLLQLFKNFPTMLEQDTTINNLETINTSLWPYDIIEDIWNIPIRKESLLQLVSEIVNDQLPTQKKLTLLEDELKQIIIEYTNNYKTTNIIAIQNTTENINTFYTYVNKIIQEHSKDIAIKTDYRTLESLGLKEF